MRNKSHNIFRIVAVMSLAILLFSISSFAGYWLYDSGNWYYIDDNGYPVSNKWIGNYYLGSDGLMLVDTWTPDGYYVGSDGEWDGQPSIYSHNNNQNNKTSTDYISNNSVNLESNYNSKSTKETKSNKEDFSDKEAKFLQYVYTDEKGRTAFKYTGSGDSEIYIPEGVEVIKMFSDYLFDLNYDITYIHLPSTAMMFAYGNVFTHESEGKNNNLYSVLYQCKNLQKVESASKWYTSENNGTMLYNTVGRIEQWEKGVLHKHDDQKYVDATIAGGGLFGYRLNQ